MGEETMVERVARAIQDLLPAWLDEDGRVNDEDLARAAIAAMREPSEVMRVASGDGPNTSARVYRAMIDAALKDT